MIDHSDAVGFPVAGTERSLSVRAGSGAERQSACAMTYAPLGRVLEVVSTVFAVPLSELRTGSCRLTHRIARSAVRELGREFSRASEYELRRALGLRGTGGMKPMVSRYYDPTYRANLERARLVLRELP